MKTAEHFAERSLRLRTEIAALWGLQPTDLDVVDYGRKLVIRTTHLIVAERVNDKDGDSIWIPAKPDREWS